MNANKWYAEGDRIFCNHKNGRWQVATVEYWQREETDRHAKLIAAAPDLLAALRYFLSVQAQPLDEDEQTRWDHQVQQAKEVLAKATGE